MHPNAELINKFYSSFQSKDAEGMVACYHADIQFSDPVFPDLRGWRAGAMWKMLCDRAKDLEISFDSVEADDTTGRAHWEARYSFGKTGNPVHNKIDASFAFKDGRIIKHTDRFSLYRWARMALGLRGVLLGWTPMVTNAVRKESDTGLVMYSKRKRLEPKG